MLHKEGNAQGTAKSSAGIVNVAENVPISVSELPKKENVFLSVKNIEETPAAATAALTSALTQQREVNVCPSASCGRRTPRVVLSAL